jgi:hypothetical protein
MQQCAGKLGEQRGFGSVGKRISHQAPRRVVSRPAKANETLRSLCGAGKHSAAGPARPTICFWQTWRRERSVRVSAFPQHQAPQGSHGETGWTTRAARGGLRLYVRQERRVRTHVAQALAQLRQRERRARRRPCWREARVEAAFRCGSGQGGDSNSKRATAAVMRYGYGRGEFFEGCEPRCREKRTAHHGLQLRLAACGSPIWKHSELHSVSGCNKPEACVRSKPSRW